jgi:hypothetical protein
MVHPRDEQSVCAKLCWYVNGRGSDHERLGAVSYLAGGHGGSGGRQGCCRGKRTNSRCSWQGPAGSKGDCRRRKRCGDTFLPSVAATCVLGLGRSFKFASCLLEHRYYDLAHCFNAARWRGPAHVYSKDCEFNSSALHQPWNVRAQS